MHFVDGKLQGAFTEYDAAGRVAARQHYVAGTLHGPASIYADGVLTAEMIQVNGVLQGPMHSYDALGRLAATALYVNGKPHGPTTIFRPDGARSKVMNYTDGKLDGESTEYFENGGVRRRALYKAGKLDGPTTEYDETGKVCMVTHYAEDKKLDGPGTGTGKSGWLGRLIGS